MTTVGQWLWFRSQAWQRSAIAYGNEAPPYWPALVTKVHNDSTVNLCVFTPSGDAQAYVAIPVFKDRGETQIGTPHALVSIEGE
jgi:hypothetical protein